MNVELLQKIKAHILEEPKRAYMPTWRLTGQDIVKRGLTPPECNTVCCISGWAAELSGHERCIGRADLLGLEGDTGYPTSRQDSGKDSASQAQRLFYTSCWPSKWQRALHRTLPQSQKYAQVVADYIDYFIKTEGKL
jgi:hypothetical protein